MKAGISRKADIYCRVSDPRQKTEGHGLESQELRLRQFARSQGYEVVHVFSEDMSGEHLNRPAMKAMLVFLHNQGSPHVVLIDHINRLSRNLRNHLTLRDQIAEAGGILEAPDMKFGDDPEEELMENISASVAHHHRRANAKQTKNRMIARTMAGYHCFHAPIGYRYDDVKPHGKFLVRVEPVATVIQDAFEKYAAGYLQNIAEVVRFLKASPDYPDTKKKSLTVQRVIDMLTLGIYAGRLNVRNWGIENIEGKHEPIVSYETFLRVQQRMKSPALVPTRADASERFALRQIVCCDECDRPLASCWTKGRSKHYPYYICQTKTCLEYGKSIKRDVIEGQFYEILKTLRPTPVLIDAAYEMFSDAWAEQADKASATAKAIQQELKELDTKIGQFADRAIEATSPALIKTYEKRIQELEDQKALLSEKMANCGRKLPDFDETFRTAFEFLKNPCILWDSGVYEAKRAVLKMAFSERLRYKRNEGFRTALTSSPISIFSCFSGEENRMVSPVGFK